jgi:hypothetical protein
MKLESIKKEEAQKLFKESIKKEELKELFTGSLYAYHIARIKIHILKLLLLISVVANIGFIINLLFN